MKKLYISLVFVGISSLYGMKKTVFNIENKSVLRNIFSTKCEKSFFKGLKEQNERFFVKIQEKIIQELNTNQLPKEILNSTTGWVMQQCGNENSYKFCQKMLLYTIGAHQPLPYILEEIKKFGPNATILAGICSNGEGRVARFQKFMIEVIFYYQNNQLESEKIKNNLLILLETSEALKIAQEQNDQLLESIIKSYYHHFKKYSAEEALTTIEKSYYQTCAIIIEWK